MKRKGALLVFLCILLLTGCGGAKNIQDLTYIVAIGMDYDEMEEEYIVYLQGLNFANVAKQEGGKPSEPIPSFVGSARGKTLNLAVSDLYSKSEPPVYFGHVKTLVLSQRLINSKSKEVLEEVARNKSLRHRLRIVTTEARIEEIFSVNALFEYPAMYTVLFKGKASGMAQDELEPTSLLYFLRSYYEPMGVAKIPTVAIDTNSWRSDKEYPVLYFGGYSIFQQQAFVKNITLEDAVLLDWLVEKEIALNHPVKDGEELIAAVKLASPKMKITYDKDKSNPSFSIELSVRADLLEKLTDVSVDKLKKVLEDDIKTQVLSLYEQGVESKMDLLNAGEKWYRKHPKAFKELKDSKNFYLQKDSLKEVKVDVQIFHFNSYEYETN
ncbi:Ger(x)C family spore germination protein [Sutcliffiella horikoshii]|uniref:Ger(X)C family spore germination protein n=1 Tax=Sutcliffiella horikoshii TaxID=79883 RepID=A0A5D4SXA8_9BACI|nr:Ger(x)C family spore germination protein [Sutcliffiella horikoshii]TYS68097.1 Ger(x)C family spore germination protein [Sutcliffiella horikoshii]